MTRLELPRLAALFGEGVSAALLKEWRADGKPRRMRKLGELGPLLLCLAVAMHPGGDGLAGALAAIAAGMDGKWELSVAGFCQARARLPLKILQLAFKLLGVKCQLRWADGDHRWRGLEILAMDKTTLALPESPELAKKLGWHKANGALGTVGAELACLFCVVARAPVAYAYAKANSSENKLFDKLFKSMPPRSVLLVDSGYYAFSLFEKILTVPGCHFVIPMAVSGRPKLVRKLGPHDYLAEIADSRRKGKTMLVRIVYAYHKGFRRRRLVTSLLDPELYPAAEIAALYHLRWTIETFYREFKVTMRANHWHCATVENFEKELACQMIVACLAKLALGDAAAASGRLPGQMSFAGSYAELKTLFTRLLRHGGRGDAGLDDCYQTLVRRCAKHKTRGRPGRSYPRDKQLYRKKARGLLKRRPGRPKRKVERPKRPEPETFTNAKGVTVLMA